MLEMSFRCFCAVAKTGSFSRAAQALFVTQPTVSRYVLALEKEWGFPLFTRTSRKVLLTQQGEMLYTLLRGFEAKWEDGLKAAKMIATDLPGRLRLGLTSGWFMERMPILGRFRRQFPNVQMEIQKFSYFALEERLAEGALDVIVQAMPNSQPPKTRGRYTSHPAFTVPGIIRVSATHPAAVHAKTVHDLGAMDMFAFSDDYRPYSTTYLTELMAGRGWQMNLVYYPNVESVLAAVDTHLGCSHTVPLAVPLAGNPEHKFYDVGTKIDIVFTWDATVQNAALTAFVDALRAAPPEDLVVLDNLF